MNRWEAMGRNYTENETAGGALAGALVGGAAHYFSRRREEEPARGVARRMPHPDARYGPIAEGIGIRGALGTPAA